jgi:hypothetical protein
MFRPLQRHHQGGFIRRKSNTANYGEDLNTILSIKISLMFHLDHQRTMMMMMIALAETVRILGSTN